MNLTNYEHKAMRDGDNKTVVEFKMKTECCSESEMRAALSFLAQESHKFHLESAKKIKCTL